MTAPQLRLAELMASLSLAMDLGTGQPLEWVMRSTLMGVRLAEALGLSEHDRRQVYYLSLLRHIGCTATASGVADLFGSEQHLQEAFVVDMEDLSQAFGFLVRKAGQGQPLNQRVRYLARTLAAGPAAKASDDRAHCEVAGQLANMLGFEANTQHALLQVYERWDGRGIPNGLKGETIALPVRVIQLAEVAITVQLMVGPEAAIKLVRERANYLYDPALVDVFCQMAPTLFGELNIPSLWDAMLAAEPGPTSWLADESFEEALQMVAYFTDLKSPYLLRHSTRVAELAERAAVQYGLPKSDACTARHAGLIHDIGRVGISSAIWNKVGPLNESEWERVRLHPNFTDRIFARSSRLAQLGTLAALHHERLDGSGYHRRLPAQLLPVLARLLAAADAYVAMTEARSYREAFSPEHAAAELHREVKGGRLDSDAVSAVLRAAGHRVKRTRKAKSADLTPRELEVLRLIARGFTTRQVAQHLSITEKTADHHIQNLYGKIGFSTRAGATLYAMQNGLLATSSDD